MSGLGWAARRLRAMGPGEIVHRARVTLRDRLSPPAWMGLAPDAAYDHLFATPVEETLRRSRLAALVHLAEEARRTDARVLGEATALDAGIWRLFGREVRLSDPPAWNRNPFTGESWPDLPAARIDYHRIDVAGGAKYTWELGRLTPLPVLALATLQTGDPRHAGRALRWLDDWNARNPIGHGIHHTSGIEMALRVITVTWTLALLGERVPPATARASLGLLAQQALWCRGHQSLGSSANNHLIAERSAMTVMGAAFPTLRGADRLAREGLDGLSRELLRQIHPDGVTAEQAFAYLPFVWELTLPALVAADAATLEIPQAVRERLAASLEFARALRIERPGPDPAAMPQVGDEDDGRILLAFERGSRLDLAGNALAAWLGADALSEDDALANLLIGHAQPTRAAQDGRRVFAHGGYTVWRESGVLLTFDHGPLGLGALAAHGHADALAITLFHGPDALVVDPGTFAYHEDPEARDLFRGTPAHATVRFGMRSQSEPLGPFMWGRRARVEAAGDHAFRCTWANGESHTRRVTLEPGGRVTIEDTVQGRDAAVVFPLAAGADVRLDGATARVTSGATRVAFTGEGLGPWTIEPAWVSPRFGTKVQAPRLVAAITGTRAKTTIALD